MERKLTLTRRDFLRLGGGALAGATMLPEATLPKLVSILFSQTEPPEPRSEQPPVVP